MISGAVRLVSYFDNVPHDFQPVKGALRVNQKHRHFAAYYYIASFSGCRWRVDAHVRPVKIAPDGHGVWLPVGINCAQGT